MSFCKIYSLSNYALNFDDSLSEQQETTAASVCRQIPTWIRLVICLVIYIQCFSVINFYLIMSCTMMEVILSLNTVFSLIMIILFDASIALGKHTASDCFGRNYPRMPGHHILIHATLHHFLYQYYLCISTIILSSPSTKKGSSFVPLLFQTSAISLHSFSGHIWCLAGYIFFSQPCK